MESLVPLEDYFSQYHIFLFSVVLCLWLRSQEIQPFHGCISINNLLCSGFVLEATLMTTHGYSLSDICRKFSFTANCFFFWFLQSFQPTSSIIPELLARLCVDIFDGAEHHIDSCSKQFGLFLLSVMVYICGKPYFFDKVQEKYFSVV